MFLTLSFLFITVYHNELCISISYTAKNYVELYDVTEKRSLPIEEIFEMRKKIMKRSCSFIKQLIDANKIATIDELKEIHYLLHDLNVPTNVITSKLKRYKQQKLELRTHFNIDSVGEPFNLIYCAPPKSGTTSWHRGVVVLKDLIEGKNNAPEDYNPREVFSQVKNRQTVFKNVTKLTQIAVSRNPFARLYSAWKDKSRTFRFKNGTVGQNAQMITEKLLMNAFYNYPIH